MEARARSSAGKHELLIAESAKLFRRRGYEATTMSEIAAATGLNKGTLYYYYPSKSDILFAIYTKAQEELDKRLELVETEAAADVLLLEHVRVVLHTIRALPDVIAVYFQEHPWLEQSLSKEQAAAIRAHEVEFTDRFTRIIAMGVKSKVFRPVDAPLLATQILASAQSFHRWHLPKTKANADAVAETVVGYVLDGIRRV